MEFNTPYSRIAHVGEENDVTNTITETAGVRTAEQQIGEIFAAGQRLTEYRKEFYDIGAGEEIDPNAVDVRVRHRNFDMADASEELGNIAERIDARGVVVDEPEADDEEEEEKVGEGGKPEA